jgi:hypothetical protein
MTSFRVVEPESAGAGSGADWALADPAEATNAIALVANSTFKKDDPRRARPEAFIRQPPVFR